MFKVPPTSLQTFIEKPNCVLEDGVQYSTVHIPNVFCLKYCIFVCFLYCNRQVHREFLIILYNAAWQISVEPSSHHAVPIEAQCQGVQISTNVVTRVYFNERY